MNRNTISPKWAFCFCDFETTGIAEDSLPIEVGCIWTDSQFAVLKTYEALTKWSQLKDDAGWRDEYMPAYDVHKIKWDEYMENGISVEAAAREISIVNAQLLKKYDRIILLSDNAKFETKHMEKMYKAACLKWDFHYCTWDSSSLLFATGVGDPTPVHRALPDASLLHVAYIKAMDRTRNLR